MDRLQIVKLATDMIQNKVSGNFADASKNSEALIEALIEANGGSSKINPKTFHRGNALFDIVEEIIPAITEEGLKGDEFFMELVEYRNLNGSFKSDAEFLEVAGVKNIFAEKIKPMIIIGKIKPIIEEDNNSQDRIVDF